MEHDLLNTRVSMTSRIRDPKKAKKSKAHKLTERQRALCDKIQLGTSGGTVHISRIETEDYLSSLNDLPEIDARLLSSGQVDCIEVVWKQRLNISK